MSLIKASFRFRREEHLKGRSRIREVFSKGKRFYEAADRLFVLKNDLPHNRICFTFTKAGSRSFGSAVARNRAKRLVREAYRLIKGQGQLAGGYDLIFLINPNPATPNPVSMSLSIRMEQLKSLFKKAGLI